MNNIFYIIGVVVVIRFTLGYWGLRCRRASGLTRSWWRSPSRRRWAWWPATRAPRRRPARRSTRRWTPTSPSARARWRRPARRSTRRPRRRRTPPRTRRQSLGETPAAATVLGGGVIFAALIACTALDWRDNGAAGERRPAGPFSPRSSYTLASLSVPATGREVCELPSILGQTSAARWLGTPVATRKAGVTV